MGPENPLYWIGLLVGCLVLAGILASIINYLRKNPGMILVILGIVLIGFFVYLSFGAMH